MELKPRKVVFAGFLQVVELASGRCHSIESPVGGMLTSMEYHYKADWKSLCGEQG